MLMHLANGYPSFYVTEQLAGLLNLLFVGFKPATGTQVFDFIRSYGIVEPREEFPSADKALSLISTFKKLKDAGLFTAVVQYETPWCKLLCKVVWYDYFQDTVSLLNLETGGYIVVSRKELFNGGSRNSRSVEENRPNTS